MHLQRKEINKAHTSWALLLLSYTLATTLHAHVYYEHYCNPEQQVSAHILEVDASIVRIEAVHAVGFSTDREDVLSIAQRTHAYAAINGGFFRRGGRYNGCPLGILKINNTLYADLFLERGALAWARDTGALIDIIKTSCTVAFGENFVAIDRINQPRADNEIILYTSAFRPTTLTHATGIEIIVDNNKIVKIQKNQGNVHIPPNGFVISCGSAVIPDFIENLDLEKPVAIQYKFGNNETWEKAEFMIGATPSLILNGQELTASQMARELASGTRVAITSDEVPADFHDDQQSSWLINGQHPRTAVGITKDNKWIFVVVDGRNTECCAGMSLPELAHFMKERGCVSAINLGGGGDSTMVINDIIVNKTSGASTGFKDTRARPVSDAICIYID